MLLFKSILFFLSQFSFANDAIQLNSNSSCTPNETWTVANRPELNWLRNYQNYLNGKESAVFSFSRAVHLKKISHLLSPGEKERDFSEFWVGRIIFDLKIDPLAHQIFKSIYDETEDQAIKAASLSCLTEINKRNPDWTAPHSIKNSDLTRFDPLLHPDEEHLVLGRKLYKEKKYKESILEFQKVKKTSNLEIDALSDLSWAYLQANQIDDAIGIAMQIRLGALKNTFAPEPIMVAAMALNELCLYPESIRMIRLFLNDYQKTHEWLEKNQNLNNLYPEVIQALKAKSTLPTKIIGEWIRSAAFQVRQDEINHLIQHPQIISETEKSAILEQKKRTDQLIFEAQEFIKTVKIEKLKLKPNEDLPEILSLQYQRIKNNLRVLSQFYQAAQTWKILSKNYLKQLPQLKNGLIDKVNSDLKVRNKTLLSRLDKIKENVNLIEIEIYNGASQDLIWKNAHRDFEVNQEQIKDDKEKPDSATTWSWGKFNSTELEDSEVWEDEIGSLKADISNQCAKKDKYSKLKIMRK